MPKYKTALVTGGAGFIGSHIVDALVKKNMKVFVVDDLSSGRQSNVSAKAEFKKCSIASPEMVAYLKEIKPDVIFHCAAQVNLRNSLIDPPSDAHTNIMGTINIVHTAASIGVKKVIYSSTGGALYPETAKLPATEEVPAEPSSPYGISKRSAEMYIHYEHQVHGMPYVTLRYANVYGPRQNAKGEAGVISIFAENMVKGNPVSIFGSGKQTRDYVYVDDVVRANMLAMTSSVVGTFNIGTSKETSVNTLFKKLKSLTNYPLQANYLAVIPGEMMRSCLNAKKAKKALGWEPKTKLDEGLKKTAKWFVGTRV